MTSEFKIGTTLAGLTTLDALSVFVPDPKTSYKPYSRVINLGSGLRLGAGWATAEWHYGFLLQTQREVLRAFCTTASAEVFIRTRIRDLSTDGTPTLFRSFKAVMIWPEEEEYRRSKRLDVTIKFVRLELQT